MSNYQHFSKLLFEFCSNFVQGTFTLVAFLSLCNHDVVVFLIDVIIHFDGRYPFG